MRDPSPPPGGHLEPFWREKKSQNKNFDDHITTILTSINAEIDRRDDGYFIIARLISDALRTKIAGALLTPWQSGGPIWSAFPSDVFEF